MALQSEKKVWVLTDYRTGTSVQAIAVAEELGLPYEIKKIEYTLLAKLPNWLLGSLSLGLSKATIDSLDRGAAPEIIISAGRRTARVALILKKRHPKAKLIHITKPEISPEKFDIIALPQHDSSNRSYDNLVRTIGSLNVIRARIAKKEFDIEKAYPGLSKFIGVLIGGDTKEYKFSNEDAQELHKILENVLSYNGTPLFITLSRRTPQVVKNYINKTNFPWPNVIYDPSISDEPNPYIGILSAAKFLIITNDSISMCSEAASSGKPLYIYKPDNFRSAKHLYFLQQLIDLGIARIIDSSTTALSEYKYTPLKEVDKVVREIRNIL
ncbi:MAG: hypothetical protein RLZZ59_70 [Pseudomonadota bacterium]|jgi:mitochondrial fission protein ELM1